MIGGGTLVEEVAHRLGPRAQRRVPLAPRCTYKVGGPAELLVMVERAEELEAVASALAAAGASLAAGPGAGAGDGGPGARGEVLPVLVLGRGSNLLVADAGFPGLVVQLGDGMARIEVRADEGRLELGGAALLPVAARRSGAEALHGFEWAVGVPGSVGGGVRMNAGGHGSDMAASLLGATLFDLHQGALLHRNRDELDLGYRHSAVAAHQVVLSATIQLHEGDRAASEAEISEIVRWRRAHQPGGQNAGSVFTNPPGHSAGRLIDQAGLKGFRIGTAEVSTKHANFIQADPDGSADDVRRVITAVRRRIWEHAGVVLHCENLLLGFDDPWDGPGPEDSPGGASPAVPS